MAVPPGPGRPRSLQVDAAVVDAVTSLLGEMSYSALSIEAVAARAGVGKATIYRRWPSKAEMVFDVVIRQGNAPLEHHGRTLQTNIRALARRVVAILSTPSARSAMPGLIADVAADEGLARRFHAEFIEPQRQVVADILSVARERDELTAMPDPAVVHAHLLGAAFTPLFLLAETPPTDLAELIADHVITSLPTRR